MTRILPRGSSLGRLTLGEVYDSYDGPRLFSAEATSGCCYLAFWAAETAEADEWLYVPISRRRLDEIVEGVVPLREAFTDAEDGFIFCVSTPFDGADGNATPVPSNSIDDELLPAADDRLSGRHVFIPETARAETNDQAQRHGRLLQKLKISARKKYAVSLEAATQCLAKWAAVFTHAFEVAGGEGDILPLDGSPGSFNLSLTVPKGAAATTAMSQIRRLVSRAAEPTSSDSFSEFNLDAFAALIEALREHSLMLTIDQESNSDAALEPIVLDFRTGAGMIPRVKEILAAEPLSSRDVPQADDLGRVLTLAELAATDVAVTTTSLQVVARQIAYYKHAGRVLRILDEENRITPVGLQLVALSSREERLAALVPQFETSRCGWRWVRWAQKTSLSEIAPETAEAFLRETVPSLSPSTAKRRSRTLESWCRTLQPYHIHALFSRMRAYDGTD